jgi:hypothetical protein
MSWWLILLVGAILVSTLHKLLPRGRDLHLARLRERARKLGFRVELQRTPLAIEVPPGMLVYKLALPRVQLEKGFAFERRSAGWERLVGAEPSPELNDLLASLPQEVRMLQRDSHFAIVVWSEPNRVEVLDRLFESLQPLTRTPVGKGMRS